MRFVMFYPSLVSDWNNGHAHFLRGVVTELSARGHAVTVYEPHDAWSVANLRAEHGQEPLTEFERFYPDLASRTYVPTQPALERWLDGADVVIVHEWNSPALVRAIGRLRRRGARFVALFHDSHHRIWSDPARVASYRLEHYDGVLAYGESLRRRYLERGWVQRAWVWHEAADARLFRPRPEVASRGDLVWIGNWGDGERAAEIQEFLLEPVRRLGLSAEVYGVGYPPDARAALARAGIDYGGWLPNWRVPELFAAHRVTVHLPRRVYRTQLPGIPTIRPFEALACGIPLILSPWGDIEGLFTPGRDFLVARDGAEMTRHLRAVLHDPELARALAVHGRQTVLARHTCAHRVDALLHILADLRPSLRHVAAVELSRRLIGGYGGSGGCERQPEIPPLQRGRRSRPESPRL